MFYSTQKPTPPTVFNLQASDWVHCENKTGAYYQLSQFTHECVIFFKQIFKVVYFAQKNTHLSKNSLKFIIKYLFFHKEVIGYTYICSKCIDNLKFTISLKS